MKKTILITGCSSGIGYCVAKGLQARGYRVFATARKQADVEMLEKEGLESFHLDLTDSNSIHFAFEETLRRDYPEQSRILAAMHCENNSKPMFSAGKN